MRGFLVKYLAHTFKMRTEQKGKGNYYKILYSFSDLLISYKHIFANKHLVIDLKMPLKCKLIATEMSISYTTCAIVPQIQILIIFDVHNIRLDPAPLKHMGTLILITAEAERQEHF